MLNVAGPTELARYGEAYGFAVQVVVSPPELSPQVKFGMICWFSTYICATGEVIMTAGVVVSICTGPNDDHQLASLH
jgi:hypothetical protein